MPQRKSGRLKVYDVVLVRDLTESCKIRVKARSPQEAETKALEQAGSYGENANGWEIDEGNLHRPYLPDPDNSAEEVSDG